MFTEEPAGLIQMSSEKNLWNTPVQSTLTLFVPYDQRKNRLVYTASNKKNKS